MSIHNLQHNISGIRDQQGYDFDGLGGSDLLQGLGERVSRALEAKEKQEMGPAQAVNEISPKDILEGIAELSQQHLQSPIAGMLQSNLV
jgi:hypothetical protein